jgi:hypothetical protein
MTTCLLGELVTPLLMGVQRTASPVRESNPLWRLASRSALANKSSIGRLAISVRPWRRMTHSPVNEAEQSQNGLWPA